MANNKLRVIGFNKGSNSVTYGIEGFPKLSVTMRVHREKKNASGVTGITNVVTEINGNATVSIGSCKDKCATEALSARWRESGSLDNREQKLALDAILVAVWNSVKADTANGFMPGQEILIDDVSSQLGILFPKPSASK